MTTYYVDPAASGANNGSSWTDAWTTLQSAADGANTSGDIVYCRGTETLSAPIDFDTNSGTAASYIHFVGCDASGTARAGQYILDGNSAAAQCILGNAVNYVSVEHFTLTGATGAGFQATNNCNEWTWLHCLFHTNGADGYDGNGQQSVVILAECIAHSNSGGGFSCDNNTRILFCRANGNSVQGFEIQTDGVIFGSLSYENGSYNVHLNGDYCCMVNSVADDTTANSGIIAGSNDVKHVIVGCRSTNNAAYGIEITTVQGFDTEDWNVFYGNVSGDLSNITSGRNSYGDGANHISDPSDDGFTNSGTDNYNVADGKELDSVEINLFWDA